MDIFGYTPIFIHSLYLLYSKIMILQDLLENLFTWDLMY